MGLFDIESGVPVPKRAVRQSKYPLEKMEVGDSFLIPDPITKSTRPSLYAIAKRYGIKLTTRLTDEGLRVWRAED